MSIDPPAEQIQSSGAADGAGLSFALLGPTGQLAAHGVAERLEAGDAASLAERARSFFGRPGKAGSLLAGALPFDRQAADFLFEPARVLRGAAARRLFSAKPPRPAAHDDWLVAAEPPAAAYAHAVARALGLIGTGALSKIVLSRSLRVDATRPIDEGDLIAALLGDPEATAFATLLPAPDAMSRRLVGATPELLVSRQGTAVLSHPLAGSARRHADPAADRASALSLQRSDKDRREHAMVVEQILDVLSPFCVELAHPGAPALKSTATMWHLGTAIAGRLRSPDTSAVELAAALHPTPAVCGVPRLEAARAIRDLEGYDRGFYAGAVGWCDAAGDGEWFVSLRCAEIEGAQARLFAGAGIVAGSEPQREVDETSAKFLAMLGALGVDENGALRKARAA